MLKIILAIVLFSVIVIFHELGHFLFAKKNGICVEEFAIGIGPTIFGKQIGETKYSIKCLPFGGCCVILGEDDDCKDPRAFGSQSALMEIFRENSMMPYHAFLQADAKTSGKRYHILSALPLQTLNSSLLEDILNQNQINKEDAQKIKTYIDKKSAQISADSFP